MELLNFWLNRAKLKKKIITEAKRAGIIPSIYKNPVTPSKQLALMEDAMVVYRLVRFDPKAIVHHEIVDEDPDITYFRKLLFEPLKFPHFDADKWAGHGI